VAIAGAGYGAQVHLPSVLAAGGVPLAIADAGSGRASSAAAKFGARVFDSWEALLDWGQFDVLTVALPPALQHAAVSAALLQGFAVLCEKPFGHDLEQAQAMCALVEKLQGFGVVGFQFRYDPAILALREALLSGAVGRIERVDVSWMTSGRADPHRAMSFQHDGAQGGGVANAFLSHVIDYLTWLTGAPLNDVRGRSGIVHGFRPDAAGRSCQVTAEDMFDLLGKCGHAHVSASVSNCVRHGDGHFISVLGTSGSLKLSIVPPFGPNDTSLRLNDGESIHELPISYRTAPARDSRTLAAAALWTDIVAAMNGEATPCLPRFRDGLIMWEALKAAKHNAMLVV